ncbi:hypothetical protein Trydic_g6782 [Trypoxylus dichotomus]
MVSNNTNWEDDKDSYLENDTTSLRRIHQAVTAKAASSENSEEALKAILEQVNSYSDEPTPTPGPSNEDMDINTKDAEAIRYTQEWADTESEKSEEEEDDEGKLEIIRKEPANNIQLRSCKDTQDGIKLFPETAADFRRLRNLLDGKKVQYHTFSLKEDKQLKVVLGGIPKEIPVEEVENELIQRGFPVSSATRVKRFKEELPLILVNAEKSSEGKKFFDMTDVAGINISAEPKRKSTAATQCFRCQKFGHIQFRCTVAFKCLRCAEQHATYECPHKDPPQRTKCANCGENHHAASKTCAQYPEEKKRPKRLRKSNRRKGSRASRTRRTQGQRKEHTTICSWSANGIKSKKDELVLFLGQENVDILLVQEIWLKKEDQYRMGGFATIRKDREGSPHVGGRLTTLISAYNRPSRKLKTEDLGDITSAPRTPVVGDLNAKSQHWNSRTQNSNGKILWRWLLINNDVAIVGPEDLTSCPHNCSRGDVIDIFIAKRIGIKGVRVVHSMDSDYFPVLAELREGRTSSTAPPKKTNWMKFAWLSSKVIYEDRDLREEEIETAAQNLSADLQATLKAAEDTPSQLTYNKWNPKQEEKALIKKKYDAKKRWVKSKKKKDKEPSILAHRSQSASSAAWGR